MRSLRTAQPWRCHTAPQKPAAKPAFAIAWAPGRVLPLATAPAPMPRVIGGDSRSAAAALCVTAKIILPHPNILVEPQQHRIPTHAALPCAPASRRCQSWLPLLQPRCSSCMRSNSVRSGAFQDASHAARAGGGVHSSRQCALRSPLLCLYHALMIKETRQLLPGNRMRWGPRNAAARLEALWARKEFQDRRAGTLLGHEWYRSGRALKKQAGIGRMAASGPIAACLCASRRAENSAGN